MSLEIDIIYLSMTNSKDIEASLNLYVFPRKCFKLVLIEATDTQVHNLGNWSPASSTSNLDQTAIQSFNQSTTSYYGSLELSPTHCGLLHLLDHFPLSRAHCPEPCCTTWDFRWSPASEVWSKRRSYRSGHRQERWTAPWSIQPRSGEDISLLLRDI